MKTIDGFRKLKDRLECIESNCNKARTMGTLFLTQRRFSVVYNLKFQTKGVVSVKFTPQYVKLQLKPIHNSLFSINLR